MRARLMSIAWPAFLAAAALEMMVFAVLDPDTLALFGEPANWSRYTVYTATFFIFWVAMMASSALTAMLVLSPFQVNHRGDVASEGG